MTYTSVVDIKKVPTRVVLEYAFAVFRINGDYIKVDNNERKVSRTFLLHCVQSWVNEQNTQSVLRYTIPEDLEIPEITDEDRKNADYVDQHFKKYMFKSLAGNLNQFENDVYTAVCGDEVAITKVGLIAYIPKLIQRDQAKWKYEAKIKKEYMDSVVSSQRNVDLDMELLCIMFEQEFAEATAKNRPVPRLLN